MTPRPRRLGAALAVVAAALVVTACSSTASPGTETDVAATPAPTTTSDAQSTPDPEPAGEAAVDLTCETMIPESTVADFESLGWTAQVQPFYAGESELTDGLLCVWADYSGPAGDHLQMFGVAPIAADVAAAAEDNLVAQGWIREDTADGVYVTENPQTTIATDADGYGMTYLFGDGWVKLADTKQGLILIEWQ